MAPRPPDPSADSPGVPGDAAADPDGEPSSDRPGVLLGRVGGVPVYLGRTWALIAIVMVAVFGPQIAAAVPSLGAGAYLVAACYAVLLLVSVLLHEAAHAVAAHRCGMRVQRVVADLWGGHTSYDAAAAAPGRSALVAVVGPLANAVVALLGWWVLPAVDASVPSLLVAAAAYTNAFVAVFNLLPGLPLDGGFLLEALVWKVTGSRYLGMLTAGWVGRVGTAVFLGWTLLLPLLRGRPPDLFAAVWVAAIGMFLWIGASQAIRTAHYGRRLETVSLDRVRRRALAVPAGIALADVVTRIRAESGADYVVLLDDAGRPVGLLDTVAAAEIDRSTAATVPASAFLVAQPTGWVIEDRVGHGSDADLVSRAVSLMSGLPTAFVAVRDGTGRVNAVLAADDLEAAAGGGPRS